MSKRRPFLKDIEFLTGLAMLFVVMGHLMEAEINNNPALDWYRLLKKYLYSFHMPLFMFTSGYLFHYTFPKLRAYSEYKTYWVKKIIRIFPSFVAVSLLVFASKLIFEKIMYVDNPVESWFSYFDVYINPVRSYAGFLWYVYVLLLYYFVIPPILKYLDIRWLFLISLPLFFVKFTDYFAINFFFQMLPFFSFGGVCEKYRENIIPKLIQFKWLFVLLFVGLSLAFPTYYFSRIVMGFAAIPFFYLVTLLLFEKLPVINLIGKYSFIIYLLQLLVIGFFKGIGLKIFPHYYEFFYIHFFILTFLGIAVPILIKKKVLPIIPVLDKYIG